MPISVSVQKSVVLTHTGAPPTVAELSKAAQDAAQQVGDAGLETPIEWRFSGETVAEAPEWRSWARHYDTVAWQVTSIFTAGSVLLGNGFVTARWIHADNGTLQAITGASIVLILFQMFIVATFRTYRYELYMSEHRRNPRAQSLEIFRRWSGNPWLVYCGVAWLALMLWIYQLSYLANSVIMCAVGLLATGLLGVTCRWGRPPVLTAAAAIMRAPGR